MILALIILQLAAFAFANPFHKYPFVFLLDVGNEELGEVNTEQIRISTQGGSIAVRYPAIGNGEDIAHVRVSGIDFGTDLKANIVDGGPGYKYVVLVLMGNRGVAYDAVITIQTVPSDKNNGYNVQLENDSKSIYYQKSKINDENNSAEDLDDSEDDTQASQVEAGKENSELIQESSNNYRYAPYEALSGYASSDHSDDDDDDDDVNGDDDDSNDDETNDGDSSVGQQDIHEQYRESVSQSDNTNEEIEDYSTNDDDNVPALIDNEPLPDKYISNDYTSNDEAQQYTSDDGNQPERMESNYYEQYQASQLNSQEGYRQGEVPNNSDNTLYIEGPEDKERPLDLEEIFGNEYDDNSGKYSDLNNNIERNDESAVDY